MSHTDILDIWTLYDHPADFPDCFVMRRFAVGPGYARATDQVFRCENIERLRELARRMGLHCIPHSPNDDPNIVESWL
jgi:hypothetical protein